MLNTSHGVRNSQSGTRNINLVSSNLNSTQILDECIRRRSTGKRGAKNGNRG